MTTWLAGDDSEFAALTQRHRRELHVHCYRMLASFDEAEDAVQETFLRAWRSRDTFDGSTLVRAWLYRIATNVCLDSLRRSRRRVASARSFAEVPWLQPYPDRLLDELPSGDHEPDAVVVDRETIELVFVVALQVLPPRQRAALIARDVLGWPAIEAAALLGTSVAAANSALQRARAAMQEHLITMPPQPFIFEGLEQIAPLLRRALGDERDGDWRLVPTVANRMPAAASYLRQWGDSTFRAFKLDVLRVEGGRIIEITTFGHSRFAGLGLADTLPD